MAQEEKKQVEEKEQEVNEVEQTDDGSQEAPEIDGASPEEVKMAQEHGLLDKEEADENEGEDERGEEGSGEKKESQGKKESKKGEVDYGNDEEELKNPDIDPEKISKYSTNEKTLYVRQKKAVREKLAKETENQLLRVQNEALREKVELLKGKKTDDIDDIDAKLDADLNDHDDDEDKILTVGEQKKREQAKQAKEVEKRKQAEELERRMDVQHKEATVLYDDKYGDGHFSYVLDLVKEVVENDKTGVYMDKLFAEAANPNGNAATLAWQIGRLHPDYDPNKTKSGSSEKKDSKNFKKIVANAEKKTSSAALGGASGDSIISEDDLTPEDVVDFSVEKWGKLKQETRDRILSMT